MKRVIRRARAMIQNGTKKRRMRRKRIFRKRLILFSGRESSSDELTLNLLKV